MSSVFTTEYYTENRLIYDGQNICSLFTVQRNYRRRTRNIKNSRHQKLRQVFTTCSSYSTWNVNERKRESARRQMTIMKNVEWVVHTRAYSQYMTLRARAINPPLWSTFSKELLIYVKFTNFWGYWWKNEAFFGGIYVNAPETHNKMDVCVFSVAFGSLKKIEFV